MMLLTADPRTITEADFPTTGTPVEQWCFLLNYALLAPSEYNTQPWLFSLQSESVDLYTDYTRRLPVVDPEDRELLISCGAACFNLRLALRHFGYQPEIEYVFSSEEKPTLLARFRFGTKSVPTSEENRLFSAILRRHTNRSLFETRAVSHTVLNRMQALAGREGTWLQVIQDAPTRRAISDLILDGDWQQWAQRSFREELTPWLHLHNSDHVDGLPSSARPRGSSQDTDSPLIVRTFDLWSEKAEEERDRQLAASAPVLAVLGTFTDTPGDWFAAGMAVERILLEACASGLQTSFVNQPIEIPALRARLCRTLNHTTDFPQVIIRIGYGDLVPSTPRRSVRDVLLEMPAQSQGIAKKGDEESTNQEGGA
jgi:nitroreductase